MTDLATLDIRIRSLEVLEGKKRLDGLEKSGFNADKSTQQLTKSAGGLGKSLGGVLRVLGPLTAGFVGFRASLGAITEFEDGLVGIAKTTGLAGKGLLEMEKRIEGLATNIGGSTVAQLLGIGEAAGQLGVRGVENIGNFTEAIAKLGDAAPALSGNIEGTALSSAKFLAITGEGVEKINSFASTIVRLGNEFEVTEDKVLNTGLEVAKAGAAFGITAAQALGLAAGFDRIGTEAEASRSAVVSVFVEMDKAIAQGGDSLELFASLAGKSVAEFSSSFKSDATGALLDFASGLGAILESGGTTSLVLEELGLNSKRLVPTLNSLAKGSADLRNVLAIAGDEFEKGTALEAEFAAGSDKLSAAFGRLQNTLKVLIDNFLDDSTGLAGALRQTIELGTDAVRVLAGMEDQIRGSSRAAIRFAGVLRGVAAGIATLAALKFQAKLAAYVVGLGHATSAVGKLNLAIAANPFGAAAVAVGILVASLNELKDVTFDVGGETVTAGEVMASVWDSNVERFQAMGRSFSDVMEKMRGESNGFDPASVIEFPVGPSGPAGDDLGGSGSMMESLMESMFGESVAHMKSAVALIKRAAVEEIDAEFGEGSFDDFNLAFNPFAQLDDMVARVSATPVIDEGQAAAMKLAADVTLLGALNFRMFAESANAASAAMDSAAGSQEKYISLWGLIASTASNAMATASDSVAAMMKEVDKALAFAGLNDQQAKIKAFSIELDLSGASDAEQQLAEFTKKIEDIGLAEKVTAESEAAAAAMENAAATAIALLADLDKELALVGKTSQQRLVFEYGVELDASGTEDAAEQLAIFEAKLSDLSFAENLEREAESVADAIERATSSTSQMLADLDRDISLFGQTANQKLVFEFGIQLLLSGATDAEQQLEAFTQKLEALTFAEKIQQEADDATAAMESAKSNVIAILADIDLALSSALSSDNDRRDQAAVIALRFELEGAGASQSVIDDEIDAFQAKIDKLNLAEKIRDASEAIANEFGNALHDIITDFDDLESTITSLGKAVNDIFIDALVIQPFKDGVADFAANLGGDIFGDTTEPEAAPDPAGLDLPALLGGAGNELSGSASAITGSAGTMSGAATALSAAAVELSAAAVSLGSGGGIDLAGTFGGVAGSGGAADGATFGPGNAPVNGGFFAAGAVFGGNGGRGLAASIGDVLTEPTAFDIGIAGEAGIETIMPTEQRGGAFGLKGLAGGESMFLPLTRDASGSLAVDMEGMGGRLPGDVGAQGRRKFAKGAVFTGSSGGSGGFGGSPPAPSQNSQKAGDTYNVSHTWQITTQDAQSFQNSKRQMERQMSRRLSETQRNR